MDDRAEEATVSRESESPEELLADTERILAGDRGESDGSSAGEQPPVDDPDAPSVGDDPDASSVEDNSATSRTGSLRSRLSPIEAIRSVLAPTRYFSAKAFLALVLVLAAAVVLGGSFIPFFGGRFLGMFATAFVLGLLPLQRRYLEVGAAGLAVGAVAALFDYAIVAVAGGGRLLAIGTTVGAVACLAGYYFGRDLRDGLSREL